MVEQDEIHRMATSRDVAERRIAATTLNGSVFPHLTNKEQATRDLLALTKDGESDVRLEAAIALGSVFPYLTDKEHTWKELIALAKEDDDKIFTGVVAGTLRDAFPHLTDKEQAMKDLLALAKNKDIWVRMRATSPLSSAAGHYVSEKDFKKASKCFSGLASVYRGMFGLIDIPLFYLDEEFYYLNRGLSCYYRGRALVSELPEKDPEDYIKNIKNAVSFFNRSINYINRSESSEYKDETNFIPICLNIYSAYYEYFLSFKDLDKKRLEKVQSYLDEASKQCKIVGTEKGERIVKVFEKFKETLKLGLEKLEQNEKIQEVNTNGKGIGEEIPRKVYINNLRKELEQDLIQLDNLLNEIIDAPITKKLLEREKEFLEELAKEEEKRRKSFWQRSYDYIKKFWQIIAAVAFILVTVAGIIQNWQFILEFIKNLLK